MFTVFISIFRIHPLNIVGSVFTIRISLKLKRKIELALLNEFTHIMLHEENSKFYQNQLFTIKLAELYQNEITMLTNLISVIII